MTAVTSRSEFRGVYLAERMLVYCFLQRGGKSKPPVFAELPAELTRVLAIPERESVTDESHW
jgi:hypothetical protein